ncbi:glutamate racemase [Erysipelothrix sp. HDW6A]|uniref:glutamate racemase n=1 Tax=Erysipelothrix sp. HDW6A TaxID=2714928 RepID=UPI00140E25C2|nr:aspartate/glutamate racemase family protein [Erysipelothrix sp. HDW6A]QIK57288.1 glutamate racemase [Erysipelothrix sp. HDW6A]
MKNKKQIGLFDSGLGGYSIYRDLRQNFPETGFVLLADQKNAPYGNKTNQEIIDTSLSAFKWFESRDIDTVIIACNTATAIALEACREAFPHMNIVGIIDMTVDQLKEYPKGEIAVVSTMATYLSHAYHDSMDRYGFRYTAKPLKKLVDYIENLEPYDEYLHDELEEVKFADYLILGCTHFPLVYDDFKKNYDHQILDSRKPIRDYVASHNHLECTGESEVYTTGDPELMEIQIKSLVGDDVKVGKAQWK